MIPHRPVVNAVSALLDTVTVWPSAVGTQPEGVAPGAPFFVVGVAPATRLIEGTWRDDGGLEWVGVQVTAVGVRLDQVLLLADAARDVILGRGNDLTYNNTISGTGWLVVERHQTATVGDQEGAVHNHHLRFDLLAAHQP